MLFSVCRKKLGFAIERERTCFLRSLFCGRAMASILKRRAETIPELDATLLMSKHRTDNRLRIR